MVRWGKSNFASCHILTCFQNLGLGVLEEKPTDFRYRKPENNDSDSESIDEETRESPKEADVLGTLLGRKKNPQNCVQIEEVADG